MKKFLVDCRLVPEHFLISEKLKYLNIKNFLEAHIYQVSSKFLILGFKKCKAFKTFSNVFWAIGH